MVDLTMTSIEKIERLRFLINDILPEYTLEVKEDSLEFLDSIKDTYDINIRTFIMVSKMRSMFVDTWRSLAMYMVSQ